MARQMTTLRRTIVSRLLIIFLATSFVVFLLWQARETTNLDAKSSNGPSEASLDTAYEVSTNDSASGSEEELYSVELNRRAGGLSTDPQWQACQTRGSGLTCYFDHDTIPVHRQTRFTSYNQLAQYGYTQKRKWTTNAADLAPIQAALQQYNIPTNPADPSWQKIRWDHTGGSDDPTTGATYPATGAYFENLYNCQHGVIVAILNRGPDNVQDAPPKAQIVPLARWSDIVFLTWADVCQGQQISGIQYIFRVNVINDVTRSIIAEATGEDLTQLKPYPGKDFLITTTSGQTVLGTPNGNGVGWFLAQHKTELGIHKKVKRIRVWWPKADDPLATAFGGKPEPSMMFFIGEYVLPQANPQSNPPAKRSCCVIL